MAKTKKVKSTDAVKIVEIHPLNRKKLKIHIVGDSPLYIHRLPTKLKIEFEARNSGKAMPKNKIRNRQQEFCESLYWLDKDGNEIPCGDKTIKHKYWGFPASGFKKAAISACRSFKGIKMTEIRGAFHVNGRYVMIKGKPKIQQEQGCDGIWVREGGKGPGTGTPNIRYRAEFSKWSAVLDITYNANMISADQLYNLFNTAGFSVGVGEDRPDKSGGTGGMFYVECS